MKTPCLDDGIITLGATAGTAAVSVGTADLIVGSADVTCEGGIVEFKFDWLFEHSCDVKSAAEGGSAVGLLTE